jgi:hypothetical protein
VTPLTAFVQSVLDGLAPAGLESRSIHGLQGESSSNARQNARCMSAAISNGPRGWGLVAWELRFVMAACSPRCRCSCCLLALHRMSAHRRPLAFPMSCRPATRARATTTERVMQRAPACAIRDSRARPAPRAPRATMTIPTAATAWQPRRAADMDRAIRAVAARALRHSRVRAAPPAPRTTMAIPPATTAWQPRRATGTGRAVPQAAARARQSSRVPTAR